MLNVLVNAYAVSPNWGSEPGMGWNWISNLARYCNLYVVTEGEWRCEIEEAVRKHPFGNHMHFYYNEVSPDIRKMCWNQGNWRFYKHYRQWQKTTLVIEKKIITDLINKEVETNEHKRIDVVHHLNMIGFREPGFEWTLANLPFVWGPVGGCELMPTGFLCGEPLKVKFALYLKNILNDLQRKYQPNFKKALKRAGAISAATKGVYEFIKEYYGNEITLLNETGCYERELPVRVEKKSSFDVVWVGKFDYRKQVGLALEAVARLKDCKTLKLHIIGTGTGDEVKRFHKLGDELGINDMVVWHGRIPNAEVQQIMRESDVFLFTSIMEGTPHVVLEAIQNALPVVCFDACGQSGVINDKVGIKIQMKNKKQAIADFSSAIYKLYEDQTLLQQMRYNCNQRQKELSWDSKAKIMLRLYEKAINEFRQQ